MDERQFIEKLNVSISKNRIDKFLYNNEFRFFRAKVFFNIINSLSKILKYFDFKNDIIFEDKIPFIKIDNIKLMICNHYYIKHVSLNINSNFTTVEKFLPHKNIDKIIIGDTKLINVFKEILNVLKLKISIFLLEKIGFINFKTLLLLQIKIFQEQSNFKDNFLCLKINVYLKHSYFKKRFIYKKN